MNAKLQLNLEELTVATFETQQTPSPAPSKDNVNGRTCMNTACPPYVCCA